MTKLTRKEQREFIRKTPIERIKYNLLEDDKIEISQTGRSYFEFDDDLSLKSVDEVLTEAYINISRYNWFSANSNEGYRDFSCLIFKSFE